MSAAMFMVCGSVDMANPFFILMIMLFHDKLVKSCGDWQGIHPFLFLSSSSE